MNTFSFTFVTPEREILKDQEAQELLCPSSKGELHILPQHAPLITLLKPGNLSYRISGKWHSFNVSWGYLEVHPHGVRVLAENAETGEEISKIEVEKKIKEINEKLQDDLLPQEEIRELHQQLELEKARSSFVQTH